MVAVACGETKTIEVPGETVTIEVPGQTVVTEVIKEVQVPGETITVVTEVIKEVQVPGETVVVTKEVVKEVIKEVQVPGETVVVTKEVVKEVEVEKIVVVEKEVAAPAKEKVLRIRMSSLPESFVPHTERSGSITQLIAMVYGGLMQADPQNKVWSPNLAERWEVSPSADSVTFYIRKGVRFHDGEPVTAEDVVFSFRSFLTAETGTRKGRSLKMIKGAPEFLEGTSPELPGVVLLDEYSFRIDLNTPNTAFLGVVGMLPVLPEHILGSVAPEDIINQRYFVDEQVGFGPFKMAKYSPGQFLEMEAYDEYHFGRPKLDGIIMRIIESGDATQIAMQREEIELNMRGGLSTDAYRAFLQDPRFRVIAGESTVIRASQINSAVEELKDPRIRQAMVYALDRQKLIDVFHNGLAVIHNQPLIHGWIQKPEWKNRYPFDPDTARSLLKAAGWDSELEIDLDVYGAQSDEIRTELAAMQQMWNDVGLKFKIVEKDVGTMLEEWDNVSYPGLQRWGWGTFSDPDGFLQAYFTSDSSNNMNYANPELDAKIQLGLTTADREQRKLIYQEIAEDLQENLPLIVEYSQLRVNVLHNSFHLPLFAHFPRATTMSTLPVASIFTGDSDPFSFHIEQWDLRD
jgi:peptide/nickel transport system substrate-binding protein